MSSKIPMPMVPVPEALEIVLKEAAKLLWFRQNSSASKATLCPPSRLVGKISADDVKAPAPGYPDHNSSIMDGYAIRTIDLIDVRGKDHEDEFVLDFVISGKIYAGDKDAVSFVKTNHRTAIYVTTGAVVPEGYDAVIPIEETELLKSHDGPDTMQIIPSKVQSVLNTKPWTWIRTIGCDIPPDSIVLSKGERIQPVHLALLTQVGMSLHDLRVKQLVRVGVLSTGNELTAVGSGVMNGVGTIPDVNRPLLLAQLARYENCDPVDFGIVTDDDGIDNIATRLNKLLWDGEDTVDVIITTGGISMGEKDVMKQVFVEGMGGKVHFGRMNMKPGKPTTFITIDQEMANGGHCKKLVFALPGNPCSASVCSELLIKPCLDLLHSDTTSDVQNSRMKIQSSESEMKSFVHWATENAAVHEEVIATLSSDVVLDKGRPEYHRVSLESVQTTDHFQTNASGADAGQQYTYKATTTGVQCSSRVLSLRNADGFMMLPWGGPLGCGYDIAKKGMPFPVLLVSPLSQSILSRTCFKDSMHRNMSFSGQKSQIRDMIKLGLITCVSEKQPQYEQIVSKISEVVIRSLSGSHQATVLHKDTIEINTDADTLTRKLSGAVNSPSMKGVGVIFVIVPDQPTHVAFRIGLEVSHAIRPMLLKNANALALQVRRGAASQYPLAALFDNVVGTVRQGTALLISCSDTGLEGAVKSISGSLRHLVSMGIMM